MTDLELDRALAVAIGYAPRSILGSSLGFIRVLHDGVWRPFSHSDLHVAHAIGSRFDCFPSWVNKRWAASCGNTSVLVFADTPQRAVALAVVEAHRRGVLKC